MHYHATEGVLNDVLNGVVGALYQHLFKPLNHIFEISELHRQVLVHRAIIDG